MSSFSAEPLFRSLPRSPDLEHLKEEAKSLKKACVQADPDAVAFLQSHLGRAPDGLKLADAQFALARSYGFKSWPRLKAFVEAQLRTPGEQAALLLRTLVGWNPTLLEELYARREQLPGSDFFLAAALGNVAVVESMLSADSSWASRVGGPLRTQAIVYVAFAPLVLFDDTYPARQERIVTLLLSHGADPNAFAPGEGESRLTALYACCRALGNPTIARLLLDAGANPDDGESLYHASELPDTRCLELVLAAGIPQAHRDYCVVRTLDSRNAAGLELYLKHGTTPHHLDFALFRDSEMRMIELLVAHGADVERPGSDFWLLKRVKGLKPVQIAERAGRIDAVSYLLDHGAQDTRTARDRLIGACAREDEDGVRAVLQAHPDLARTLTEQDHSNLATHARNGRRKSVELMLAAGFDIEAKADDLEATGLHYAGTRGDLAMAKLLLERGASLTATHKYGGDPLGTTLYCAVHFRNPAGQYAETVRLLLQAGSKATDEQLRQAVEHELDDVAGVLKEFGALM